MNFKEIINNRYAIYIIIIVILFLVYYNSMKTSLTDIEVKTRETTENFESYLEDYNTEKINLINISNIINTLKSDISLDEKTIYELLLLIEKKIPSVELYLNNIIEEQLNSEYNNITEYKNTVDNFFSKKYKEYINDKLNEFSDYNIIPDLEVELTSRIIKTQITNLSNIEKGDTNDNEEPEPTATSGTFGIIDQVNNMEKSVDNISSSTFKRQQYVYLLEKLGTSNEELAQAISDSANVNVEGFTNNSNNITSFDGLNTVQLNKIKKYNDDNKSPYSHETLLIDPLKIISNVQDDTISLLEKTFQKYEPTDTTNGNITTSTNPTTTQEGFDASNRGSYLTNSPTDKIVNPHVSNLSYNSKEAEQPKYLSSQSKVFKTLKEKESDIEEIKSRKYGNDTEKEGFEDGTTTTDANNKSSSTIKLFDGFIKYSANILTSLIKMIINFDVNELDTNKLTSYGVVLIIISVILYFISISS